jgi:MoaA/NifB/PqqE/SkfB family radical SAM enzyme
MLDSRGRLKGAVNLTADLIPASLFGGRTAYGRLAEIDVRRCRTAAETTAVLNQSKPSLFDALRRRFSEIEAQALTVKILNLWMSCHHFRACDARLLSHPFGLVVDPSNVCQLACPGCVHSSRSEGLKLFNWPNGTLTTQRFETLLQLCGSTAVAIYFCDYGEPLLNVNTPKLVRRAKMYLMATALSTSLSVRRFDAEAYVELGLDFMVLSIDGATQAVYERFRRNGNLELVFDNVRKLVETKRRLGRKTPRLSWNFLAFEHNAHQIPEAERMARRLGVNYFRVVNPFDVTWDDPDIRPARVKPRVRRLDWTTVSNPPENWNPLGDSLENGILAAVFRKEFDANAPAEATASTGHTCHWLYKNMVMDATGRILPCCGAPRADTQIVFGTLDGAGTDPFNSERYQRARALFRGDDGAAGERIYCANCEWDQTAVNIGAPEIRRYFHAADPWFFDRRSVRLLADW